MQGRGRLVAVSRVGREAEGQLGERHGLGGGDEPVLVLNWLPHVDQPVVPRARLQQLVQLLFAHHPVRTLPILVQPRRHRPVRSPARRAHGDPEQSSPQEHPQETTTPQSHE